MRELIDETKQWAEEKGITKAGTVSGQFKKFMEEAGELGGSLIDDRKADIIDGLGDTLVTLIILAELKGLDVEQCLQAALDEIRDRKGKMIDGVFVKDE